MQTCLLTTSLIPNSVLFFVLEGHLGNTLVCHAGHVQCFHHSCNDMAFNNWFKEIAACIVVIFWFIDYIRPIKDILEVIQCANLPKIACLEWVLSYHLQE